VRTPIRPRLVACAAAVALIVACGKDDDRAATGGPNAAPPAGATPALEGRLHLLATPGLAERGKSDPRYDWIGGFEQRTGCRVDVETVPGQAQLLARLAMPGVDIAIVPGDIVVTLVANGDVRAIETTRVTGLVHVDARLADGAWARLDGLRYAVPFAWRPQGLLYRTDVFGTTRPTGAELFAPRSLPDGKPNTGRVQMVDSPMAIADAALFLAATRPRLRIDDPHSLDAAQYFEALALLRMQAPLLHRYWTDPKAQRQELDNGVVALATGWPPPARSANDGDGKVAWTAPVGDVPAQVDAAVIATRAEHPNCAYAWLAWSLEPAPQAAAAAWRGAVPANLQACAEPLLGPAACRAQGADLLVRARFRRPAQAACGRKGGCVPYSRWTEDFHAVRGD
jgi:putative spermidine/putrescine transport system substrate-binding protein